MKWLAYDDYKLLNEAREEDSYDLIQRNPYIWKIIFTVENGKLIPDKRSGSIADVKKFTTPTRQNNIILDKKEFQLMTMVERNIISCILM